VTSSNRLNESLLIITLQRKYDHGKSLTYLIKLLKSRLHKVQRLQNVITTSNILSTDTSLQLLRRGYLTTLSTSHFLEHRMRQEDDCELQLISRHCSSISLKRLANTTLIRTAGNSAKFPTTSRTQVATATQTCSVSPECKGIQTTLDYPGAD
jgi:hypothetical protein